MGRMASFLMIFPRLFRFSKLPGMRENHANARKMFHLWVASTLLEFVEKWFYTVFGGIQMAYGPRSAKNCPAIPKGLNHSAQGCEARATLG
jgi:hypothetical protein